jgi:glycosyltransferase involved in cell wall biosynthesis
MKILVVTQYYYPESFAITSLCEGLVQLGHHVQVLTSKPQYGFGQIPKDYRKITDEIISGVNIHRVHTFARQSSILSTLRNYWTFYHHASQAVERLFGHYEVVLSVSLSPLMSIIPGIQYAKKHGVPHLLYAVDVWPESLKASKKITLSKFLYQQLTAWSHRLYQRVDQILVGSPSYVRHFLPIVGKHHVIAKAMIQPALIESYPPAMVDYGEGFHLVYAGNLGTIQSLWAVVKQWHTLPKHFHFHLIGTGSQTTALKQYVQQHQLQQQVHFYAHQTPDTLGKFLLDADAFYVGLRLEGIVGKTIPHKLIQYLTIGKPMVSNLSGDGLALLKTIGTHYPLRPDASNLATVLKQIDRLPPSTLSAIKQTQQSYYRDHLSQATAAKTLEGHLLSLIQANKR